MEQNWDVVTFNPKGDQSSRLAASKSTSQRVTARTEAGIRISDLEAGDVAPLPKSTASFRTALAQARAVKGYTQATLAHHCNMPASTVRDWEAGKGVPPTNVQVSKLRTVLGVSLPVASGKSQ